MAHAITPAIEGAYVVGGRTRQASSSASELRLRGSSNLLLLRTCKLLLSSTRELQLLWCWRNRLMAQLLRRHARVARCSRIARWVRARGAIWMWLSLRCRLLLDRCAARGWEVLLLRVVLRRRVLGLTSTRWRGVVLVLLLMRRRRGRRWWVGLAAWRRRVVLLLALLLALLVCRMSVLSVEIGW